MNTKLCEWSPVFKANELAKLYYESDIMKKGKWVVRETDLGYCVFKNNNKVESILDTVCPFLKDGECVIEKYKPEYCKKLHAGNYNSVEEGLFKIVPKFDPLGKLREIKNKKDLKIIKPFNRNDLKQLNYDMVLYYVLFNLMRVDYNKTPVHMTEDYEYKLVSYNGKTISSIKEIIYTADKPYEDISRIQNKLNRKFLYKDKDYNNLVMEKANRLLAGIKFPKIPDELFNNVTDKEKVEETMKLIFNLYLIADVSDTRIKYIKNYFKDVDTVYLKYLARYNLDAIFGNEEPLKERDEIKISDILLRRDESKAVDEILTKTMSLLKKTFKY